MAQVYDIRKIDGVAFPLKLQAFKRDLYDLDKDAHTTASGLLVRNKVATKNKFFITTPEMKKSELQLFLAMIEDDVLVIEYEDIFDSTIKTGNFYRGDISVEVAQILSEDNTDVWVKPFAINFIEY